MKAGSSVINNHCPTQTAEFPGPKLQFMFHSDGSNNEWGYLFTVRFIGHVVGGDDVVHFTFYNS